jgi:hypothetical protein
MIAIQVSYYEKETQKAEMLIIVPETEPFVTAANAFYQCKREGKISFMSVHSENVLVR